MIALDANILLRLVDNAHPLNGTATIALEKCRQRDRIVMFPQAIFEFWAVATKTKKANGLAMTPEAAATWTAYFRTAIEVLPDSAELLDRWQALVTTHRVSGTPVHDTRYVAAMQCHGVDSILTFNGTYFRSYPITVLNPESL